MFRSRKAKIVSVPTEEILEVEEHLPEPTWLDEWDEDPWQNVEVWEEPEFQQVTNIEFLIVDNVDGEMQWGKLTDYDNNHYEFQWDTRSNRIVRLIGNRVDKLTWDLCNDVLRKYYIRPEAPKTEELVVPQVEQIINKAVKGIEGKIEKALAVKPATVPAPAQTAPRPQAVQSMPTVDAPAISVADDDISMNAMRFLQQSDVQDLGIDYMSL